VDQGTGCTAEGAGEPVVRFLRAGARLVCFSADKVLGGPQAGIVVGDAGLVAKLAAHPLMRALQPGKTVLSLLEATLIERLGDENGSSVSPAERALSRTGAEGGVELKSFGRRVLKRLPKERARLVPIPEGRAASWAIELQPASSPEPQAGTAPIRAPVAGTIAGDRVLLDLLAAVDEDPAELAESIAAALSRRLPAGLRPDDQIRDIRYNLRGGTFVNAIITVVGSDKVGIIARVSAFWPSETSISRTSARPSCRATSS
jgi:L-seryl-tRNA(Ser) seleniumtransferase